jgi:transcriptional regulator with XRE-family HTH domain
VPEWSSLPGREWGEVLRARIDECQLTVREVAKLAKVSPGYLFLLLKGKAPPPSEQVVLRLAEILGADEHETDRWLAAVGRIRSSKLAGVLGQTQFLEALRGATGLPIDQLKTLTEIAVQRMVGRERQ